MTDNADDRAGYLTAEQADELFSEQQLDETEELQQELQQYLALLALTIKRDTGCIEHG